MRAVSRFALVVLLFEGVWDLESGITAWAFDDLSGHLGLGHELHGTRGAIEVHGAVGVLED